MAIMFISEESDILLEERVLELLLLFNDVNGGNLILLYWL